MTKEEFIFANRHGKRLASTLRIPDGAPKGTVLVLHGLAGWKDQSTVALMADAAAQAGYVAFAFDGAHGLRGPDASYWKHTTTAFIEDMEDAVEYMQRQEWFTGPLILAGHSLGALCAVRYARQHPEAVSRLLLVAPATSLLKDRGGKVFAKALHTLDAVRVLGKREKDTGETFLIPLYPPWIFDYLGYDTRKDAPHVQVPVFVISAGGDLVVASPDVHEDLAERFPDAVHAVIPHASHTFHEHEAALADTITAWLT